MELVYYVAASLDGYIATPDGGVDWLEPFNGGDDDYGYGDFYAAVDVLLMGGNTCRQLLDFGSWPYPDKPTIAFSRQAVPVDGRPLSCESRTPAEVLHELERQGRRRAWLVGGGRMAASCLREGLVTDVILSTMPVLLGSGTPLVESLPATLGLTLQESRTFSNGVVQSHYRVDQLDR
jgi:dihydrofolate reductase